MATAFCAQRGSSATPVLSGQGRIQVHLCLLANMVRLAACHERTPRGRAVPVDVVIGQGRPALGQAVNGRRENLRVVI